ncbi:DNA polymerase III subunit alpha [Streptomyces sp. SID13588]|uniref:DNA polymerase III subunit alpha n=1 Tax=Streptomyces sp. SID13588 TaxID=2706051 RepID=UPI0013CB5DFE|nr:DNA polymerase III subunit alpha [Streptomyces sp. SID13588]NEA75607.1 DNA polymerase III subunit alpha [Streptomyces sp. SID13588]
MSFTHLHTASGFSLRYGASHPGALAERAAWHAMDALALTDRDTVAGLVRFAAACTAGGVRPVFGVDLAVESAPPLSVPGSAPGTAPARRRTPVRGGAYIDESAPRIVLLARNAAGWAALCRLVSAAHAGGDRPLLRWADLERQSADGLTVLLGPASEPVRALSAGRPDSAERLLAPWRERFGEDLRLEAVDHGIPGAGPGSLRLAAHTVGLADRLGIPAVVTNAVRYADPAQHRVADVLDAARLLRPIDRRRLDSGQRWLKSPQDMARVAERIAGAAGRGRGGAARVLAVTRETADACRIDPKGDLGMGRPHFPEPELAGATAATAGRVLRERAEAGLARRGLEHAPDARRRLDAELTIIGTLGFETYFLTVAAVVSDARDLGIRVAARGSGAGSMVNYALGISHVDPLEHHLVFERFMSLRRNSLPDIDLDTESARRLDVYRAVIGRFGPARIATVAMPETYRARHAIRDTGAALSLPPWEIDRLAKSFPHIRARDVRAALAELPELREVAAHADRYGPLWELVEALDGLPRGVAMHPCGVLLSNASLLDRTPVVPTSGEALPMSQFDKEDVEAMGLLKLDILGVRMWSAMAHATAEIRRATGRDIDLEDRAQVPPDDPAAFELIRASDTLGMFQLESPGQRDLLARLQPTTVDDIVADISLFRPGPVAGGMPEQYIAARHSTRPPRYPHQDLEPVLRDTFGVTIWHEQIIGIIAVLTRCEPDLAEEARRCLADPVRRPKVRKWFHREAAAHGYAPAVLAEVWGILEAFGAYGFARAHAAAFAVPALQSAWLKAHFSAALYAGLLEHDPGMWPKRVILADARRHGVPILPLDVNASRSAYVIELKSDKWGVRLALSEVGGMSEVEAGRIEAGQPYSSPADLWERARPSRPVLERLVQVGALAALAAGPTRRDLLLQVSELHRQGRADVPGGQLALAAQESAVPAGLPDMNAGERTGAELEVLGMDTTQHLMEHHHALLEELDTTPARRLHEVRHGETVLVAGIRASTQTPPIASGKRIIFVTLDDGSGLVDLAFFEDSHQQAAHTVFHSGLLLVRGTLQRRGKRAFGVVGSAAWDLAELADLHQDGGLVAVAARLAEPSAHPTTAPATDATAGSTADPAVRPGAAAADPVGGRRIRHETGAELHPWADLQPPGDRTAPSRKLWHSSQGSAG